MADSPVPGGSPGSSTAIGKKVSMPPDNVGPPNLYGWRKVHYHKVPVNVPNATAFRRRPNMGPLAGKTHFTKGIDGRTAATLKRLFRSKSQKSMSVLKDLQDALVGHIIECDYIFADSAPFLRTANGMILVYRKPSFRAVRLLIMTLSRCKRTTFKLKESYRNL